MNKSEIETLLTEFDDALVHSFPGSELLRVLVVGGACLLFHDVITRPTEDVDVIIFEMLGSEESTLIFHSPLADKIRRIIKGIGERHGLRGDHQIFFNDDCSPFLLELSQNELPPMRLLKAYQKLQLYAPSDLRYILACKLMAGRPEKDLSDIAALCQLLCIQNRVQAQNVVNQYFPSLVHQAMYKGYSEFRVDSCENFTRLLCSHPSWQAERWAFTPVKILSAFHAKIRIACISCLKRFRTSLFIEILTAELQD